MKMKMRHRLACIRAAVGYNAVASGQARLRCKGGDERENVCDSFCVICGYGIGRGNVCFRYHEKVNGRLRVDVVKSKHTVVLIQLV